MPKKPKIAFWLETASQHACEIARVAGFDMVILDMEHGICSEKEADRLIPLIKGLGLQAYSRVAAPERAPIQHALDSGADGVILPQIQDVEQARVTSGFAKFPPGGTRGVGWSRVMGYGPTPRAWPAKENKRTVCYAQIETLGALSDVEAIAALPTVDGLFLGPSDMSMVRGRGMARWTNADVEDLNRVAKAAHKAGKLFATTGAESSHSRKAGLKASADLLTAGDDLSAMVIGFAQLIAAARKR